MGKQDVELLNATVRHGGVQTSSLDLAGIADALSRVTRPFLLHREQDPGLGDSSGPEIQVPACLPRDLGDATFLRDHGLRFPYIAGAMANGISSPELVEEMGRAGMLGIFGAAGLAPAKVEAAVDRLTMRLGDRPWGCSLLHSPFEQGLESKLTDIYINHGVRLVSAGAYMDVSLPLVRYRVQGIATDASGRVVTPNKIIGKVSRIEVARKFLAPPPERMLAELVGRGEIDESQARMAATVPLAQDLTVEADSGGHTDNRPALALVPTMLALRDNAQQEHGYKEPLRVGAAGGIATPHAAAAVFSMGAAYIVTGTVNQVCVEAGTSETVKQMLEDAEQADVMMAPAADMFEMGVKLQVLKRGTLFPMRAQKLYELYKDYPGLDQIPAKERESIEKTIFRAPLGQIWEDTKSFWRSRDPRMIERAEQDPKHLMALVFRWYLGRSSIWANSGEESRKIDYQIWCGPAIGAFNEWVRGSFLEPWRSRRVVTVALNILYGAAVMARARFLTSQGVALPSASLRLAPRQPAEIEDLLR
jgi:trans-AT polyketide synthase/acyltransferase/oxidoreductase domain-containing protein